MLFRTLGPLAVSRTDGGDVVLRGKMPRRLLTVLLLAPNTWIDAERLVQALWENPPATALANVRTYIWILRKELPKRCGGAPRIESSPGRYRVLVERHELDLLVFEDRIREGKASLAARRPGEAMSELESALGLWRGAPFEDAPPEGRSGALARLQELRLAAAEDLLEARLLLGAYGDVAAEARALLADNPFRERLWAQLMLALYRTDRQAEALRAYDDARRLLDTELAVRPGRTLERLHLAILRGEPFTPGTATGPIGAPEPPSLPAASQSAEKPEEKGTGGPQRVANAPMSQHNDDMGVPGVARRRSCVSAESGDTGFAAPAGPPSASSRRGTFVPRDRVLDAFATAPVILREPAGCSAGSPGTVGPSADGEGRDPDHRTGRPAEGAAEPEGPP